MADSAPPFKLTRPSEVRAWIESHAFLPSRALGQNFLIDENILNIMVAAAGPVPDDRLLEIGPGLGILTGPLLRHSGHVVAVEKDKRLAEHLRQHFQEETRLTLITADALALPMDQLIADHGLNKLAANLPYSVASRLLVECFLARNGFDLIVVTVQREVGGRLAARVNTADYGLLSIWAQLDYEARMVKVISPSCFYPRPQVTSAIIRLERRATPRRNRLRSPALFDALIKKAFSHRRKQIGTILNTARLPGQGVEGPEALRLAGIEARRRPETLTVEEWIALADTFAAPG